MIVRLIAMVSVGTTLAYIVRHVADIVGLHPVTGAVLSFLVAWEFCWWNARYRIF